MNASQVEPLVRQHLLQERGFLDGGGCAVIEQWPWIDVGEAIARTAVAPEHHIGERPLALFTMEEDYPDSFNGFLLITDRRFVGRFPRLNGTFGDVHLRYGWLQGARLESGMLTNKLHVQHAEQAIVLEYGVYNEKLKAFIDALAAIEPEQREPAPSPICAPSEADPTGARAAQAVLAPDDRRTAFLLEYVANATHAGSMTPAIGADLVARVVLQHRNERYGRGVNDGSWMSPLGRDDLSNVLVALYQNPIRHVEEPTRALTFDVRNKVDKVFDALDAADAVLALDIGAFVGPKPSNHFTAMMLDAGPSCSFRLFDNNTPLRQRAPELTEQIHALLDRLEAAMVLRRCAYGWNASAPELLQVPSSDIVQRFEAVMGPFDATVLGRPQDQGGRKRKR